jgi:hypothetical protein
LIVFHSGVKQDVISNTFSKNNQKIIPIIFTTSATPDCGTLVPPVVWLGLPSAVVAFVNVWRFGFLIALSPPHEASLIYHTAVASHRTPGKLAHSYFTSLEFFSMDHH